MKLSKFLRKNSRTLILVFMSLLLVAFLIPDTIQTLGGRDPTSRVVLGHVFGRKITLQDQQRASADLHLLSNLGLVQRVPEEAVLDYFLMMEEARQMGLRVSREEVKTHLAQSQFPPERLRAVQQQTHRSYDEIYDLIGRWMAARRLWELQASAIVGSLPRMQREYRDRQEQAVVKLSILDDRAFLSQIPDPSEEELRAFFDECKDRDAAHTEEKLVFGYRLPDRVRVEYLTVDPDKVRERLIVQSVQVKRYFQDNAQRYTKPDPTASQPAGGQVPQVPMTFEEARDRAREDYRRARSIELAQSLVNDMYMEAHRGWGLAGRDAEGFALPPEAEPPTFEQLRQRFSREYEVEYGQTDLLDAEALGRVPGLGRAGLQFGQQLMQVPQLAFRVKGLLEKDTNDGRPVLNLLEPAPVVLTVRIDPVTRQRTPYQAYLFRVVEVAPAGPPESLEPIRARVIEDWKLMRAHELAGQHARALAATAQEVGLTAAIEQAAELRALLTAAEQAASQPSEGVPPAGTPRYAADLEPADVPGLTRSSSFIARLGSVPRLTQTIFGLAGSAAPVTEPAHRVAAAPVASQHKWVVVELTEIKPLYEGAFETELVLYQQRGNWSELQRFYMDWLAPGRVRDRTRFEPDAARQENMPR